MTTAVVRIVDLDIVKTYTSETQSTLDAEFLDEDLYTHVEVSSNLTLYNLKAQLVNSSIELYNDASFATDYTARMMIAIRTQRDQLLKACDWVMLSDVPMSTETRDAWITYRQALRDVPSNYDPMSFTEIEWPTPPS